MLSKIRITKSSFINCLASSGFITFQVHVYCPFSRTKYKQQKYTLPMITQYFSRSFNMENVVSCIKIQFYKKCTKTVKHTVTVWCHGHGHSIKLTVSFRVNCWKRNTRKVNMILEESEWITLEFGTTWKKLGVCMLLKEVYFAYQGCVYVMQYNWKYSNM